MAKQIVITCPEVMDITVVSGFHEQLKEQLGTGSQLLLEAAAVTRVDTAFLQMLAALFLDASARQIPIAWKAPPEKLLEAARLLGLQDALSLPAGT